MEEWIQAAFSGSTLGVLIAGFLLGLWHAHEADHLAAVATIVTERKSLWSAAVVGGFWGIGHTISLLLAGVIILLLNIQIGEQAERILEFCVGVMLVLLGANVLRKLAQGKTLHFHAHQHGELVHAHPHVHEHDEADGKATHHGFSFSPRALAVGMVHGLAGSAAVMLLFLPTIDSRALGFLYLIIFGAGSIGGMMLMSLLIGLPLSLTARRFNRFNFALQLIAGAFSLVWGLKVMYENGFPEGFFS